MASGIKTFHDEQSKQGVSIPGVRASLSAYLAHLVTCCERNTSQQKTSNLKGYYYLINNSFENHVRHRPQQRKLIKSPLQVYNRK